MHVRLTQSARVNQRHHSLLPHSRSQLPSSSGSCARLWPRLSFLLHLALKMFLSEQWIPRFLRPFRSR